MIVSRFRAAVDLGTYPLSNLIHPRCAEQAKSGQGKPVLIRHIAFFACFHAISLEHSHFRKRIVVNRQTDRQTDIQTRYCNPRCARTPRVNNFLFFTSIMILIIYMMGLEAECSM